ncbi:MAG: hypothetical protein DRJ01_02205 [Bacteroidetes bacterium]|nr:MAG: hypothetical protein DRJ01_02205 [Bacteroidota bacterium]
MGCGKICQAKKSAAKGQRQADQAKRDANKQVKDAEKQAANAQAAGSVSPYDLTVTHYTVEVITIGKFLGIDNKRNALSIREMFALLQTASRSPQILSSAVAKSLIQPIAVAMGFYVGFDIGRKIFLLVKPGFKILQQINDIFTFNFAALNVLIWDILQMVLQFSLGLFPYLIELLKNIFLNIPLYTKILTSQQTIRISGMLAMAQISMRERISNVIDNFKIEKSYCAPGSNTCPEITEPQSEMSLIADEINTNILTYVQHDPIPTLEDLTDVNTFHYWTEKYMIAGMDCARKECLNQVVDASMEEEIDILEIPGFQNETVDNKKNMKLMVDGLLVVSQKTEAAIAEELLRKQFSVSQLLPEEQNQKYGDTLLASAMADSVIAELRRTINVVFEGFNESDGSIYPQVDLCYLVTYELNNEIRKKLDIVEEERQYIIVVTIAESLVQNNKIQIFDNIIQSLVNVGFNPDDIILNDCMSVGINNDFNTMKANIINDNFTKIDNDVTVVDTTTMIALRNEIYADTVAAINDELIIPDSTCGFADDVCRNINKFKANLVLEIQKNMEGTSINISNSDVPDYVDTKELKGAVNMFNTEIVKQLMDIVRTIILESVLPCEACRPCEDMNQDLVAYATEKIEKIKDEMIRNADVFILDETLDWTVTNAPSAVIKKQQLIDVSNAAVSENAGVVDMFDTFIYRLKAEEKEIINNIMSTIKSS